MTNEEKLKGLSTEELAEKLNESLSFLNLMVKL